MEATNSPLFDYMAISYITILELRNATTNDALIDEADERLESLIERAERYIDAIAGYWQKYEEDQARIFPRVEDVNTSGATFIPEIVKEATIAQTEFLYLQTPDAEHGVKPDDAKKPFVVYSPRAKAILRSGGLTRRTGLAKLSDGSGRYDPDKL